ncbi:BrnT family toxin [Paludibaculum fermentans]|uniref:BrnT family toxin n=1 Tax=Paludibaculum fermentans TaxID=1473598 RepID=UPI00389959E1
MFEWDPRKARANLVKHGVSFSEAASVFGDALARIFSDDDHSTNERREIIIGRSQLQRLVVVCFTELREGRVRVISARRQVRQSRDHRKLLEETSCRNDGNKLVLHVMELH